MKTDRIAGRRYGRALFQLAEETGSCEAVEQDLENLLKTLASHREISRLVSNPTLPLSLKKDFIRKIFSQPLSKLLLHFVQVVITKGHFNEIKLIREEYHRLFEKRQGVREVQVVTARALAEPLEQKLTQVLAKRLKARIRLIPRVQPDILGGMILRFDHEEIDASFRTRLVELRQKLMS